MRNSYFCINPILHGGWFTEPPLVDDLSWFLSGCSKWAQISWLCFFQHFTSPIEAIFQKKFWNFENWKKDFLIVSTSKGPPFEKNFLKFFFSYFFAINHIFFIWIWILHVFSFLLMYITYTFIKIFEFSLFYYEFSVDYQFHSSASHSKNIHQKLSFLVPMDC